MKKVVTYPMTDEKMTVICNIQAMWTACGIYHDEADFSFLSERSIEDLRSVQEKLIPTYNESVKAKHNEHSEPKN